MTRDIGPDRKIDDDDNRDGTAGHDVHADADGGATNRSALERADTIPATLVTPPPSGLTALYDDDAFKSLFAWVNEARKFLGERAWDNLAHVERFARAARFIWKGIPLDAEAGTQLELDDDGSSSLEGPATLFNTFAEPQQRRALAHLLWMLLPPSQRARPHLPLPDELARRADDGFALTSDDVPAIAAVFSAFLGRDDLIARTVRTGASLLAPRHACPGAARGACALLDVDDVANGVARLHVPPGVVGAERVEVRLGPDLKPLLSVEGKSEPITLPLDQLAAWLLGAGPDARGLDLRSDDDRALLLTWTHLLRTTNLGGRSAWAWLELANEDTTRGVRIQVVDAAIKAAIDAVALYTMDPIATRFVFRAHESDGGWTKKACAWLDDVDMFRDVHPRGQNVGSAPAAGLELREVMWTDAILGEGFAAGRLTPVAAGRAFARLATSVLAPLGVLPLSGLKDGSGAVVLQRLLPDDAEGNLVVARPRLVWFADGVHDVPLTEAWNDGRGTALPDPKGAPRHDVQQMPAWLAFFLESVGATDYAMEGRP